jgi:CubicO group peptidase (beta-lactamase class C family)
VVDRVEGGVWGAGTFGQYIYVNPQEHLVIVGLTAQPKPEDDSRDELSSTFVTAVKTALH